MWWMWRHRKHVVGLGGRQNVPPRCYLSWCLSPGGPGQALVSLMQVSSCWGSGTLGEARMSLGAGCRSPFLSAEPVPHTRCLCLQLWKLFACYWRRGGQSPAMGWEEALPWGTKGTGVRLLPAQSSAASRGGVGHPWALWWQSPGSGVRPGRDHPIPVLEIPVVKGGWGVLVQHFPLATLVVWRVPLCACVFPGVFPRVFP